MPRKIGEPGEPSSDQEVELIADQKEGLEKYKKELKGFDVKTLLRKFANVSELQKGSSEALKMSEGYEAEGAFRRSVKEFEIELQMIIDEVTRRIDNGKTAEQGSKIGDVLADFFALAIDTDL